MTAINEQALALGPQLSPEMMEMVRQSQQAWETIFEHFNLFSALRTLPVGVPSLLAFRGVITNPLGRVGIYESTSLLAAFGSWLVIVLVGVLLGTIYFNTVARFSGDAVQPFSLRLLARQYAQTIVLTLILLLVLLIILVPLFIVLSISALINPLLGQVVLFAMTFLLLWLLLPLFFSPHGIFMTMKRAQDAVFQSLRLARVFMPNTGLMILVIVLIGQGMNIIWLLAEWDSWMALVGIAGHAFISSGLLAATFVYYRQGVEWLEERSRPQQEETPLA